MVTETAAAVGAVAGGMVGRIGTGVGAVIVQALRLPLAPLPPCTSSKATQRRTLLRRARTCPGLRPHTTPRASSWADPKVVACDCVCRLLRLLCVVLHCVLSPTYLLSVTYAFPVLSCGLYELSSMRHETPGEAAIPLELVQAAVSYVSGQLSWCKQLYLLCSS
jgi:hypothetical protein